MTFGEHSRLLKDIRAAKLQLEKKNEYYEEHAKIIEECQKARDCIGNYEMSSGILQPDFPNQECFK